MMGRLRHAAVNAGFNRSIVGRNRATENHAIQQRRNLHRAQHTLATQRWCARTLPTPALARFPDDRARRTQHWPAIAWKQ
jgi:hypothetical protein